MNSKHERFFISTRWLLINLLILAPFWSSAQIYQNTRFEIPILSNDEQFKVVSAKTQGLVLYRQVFTSKNEQLEIIHLDTSFIEKWRGFLPIPKKFLLAQQVTTDKNLYLIFYNREFSDRNFHLFQVSLSTGSYTKYIVRNSISFVPSYFEATSQGAIIGGYFSRIPIALFFQFKTSDSKILPGLFNESGELAQIKVNPDESFDILISSKNYQKQQTIWIKNYDPLGRLIRNIMLEPEGHNYLIFGRTIQTTNNVQIVAGVFGNNNEYSRGLFVASVTSDGLQQIRYYNFGDLENFFKYMRAKREIRVKERISKRKVRGKKIKLRYRFIVHELASSQDQFILLGEAFYPRYKYIDRGYTVESTAGYQPYSTVFDGYQYTHAVVIGIALNGDVLWDNSFEINDVKTFTLEQFVKMDAQEDRVALLYLYDNKIRTKIISNNSVLEGKTYSELQMKFNETLSNEDKTHINKLDYWYGRYFLASGVQNVVSPTLKGEFKRKVFFVNKIRYQ